MNAEISKKAVIGANVTIGFGTKIYDNVVIGDDTVIGDFCVIGLPPFRPIEGNPPLKIGKNSNIRSHAVLYEGSDIGDRLETGHHIVIREKSKIGTNLRIGNFSDIEGTCSIGDYCRFHGYVHVGKGSEIGSFVWLFSLVTLTNDPLPPSHIERPVTIEDGVVVSVGATPMPGCHLEKGAFVVAGCRVNGRVAKGMVASEDGANTPVKFLLDIGSGTRHPWMKHFADAYPDEAQERLRQLKEEILNG